MAGRPSPYINIQHRLLTWSVVDEQGCWVWIGRTQQDGYGRLNVYEDGRAVTRFAHRVSYETFKQPIPAKHDIDHKCKNRACINPEHLRTEHYKTHRARTSFPKANPPRN